MTGIFLKPTMGFLTLADNNNNISRLSKKTYEKPLKQVQCSTPKLDKEKIRLLVIGDTEKGRIPYFDSNAILRLDDKGVEQPNKPLKSACKLVLGNKQLKDSPGCSPSKNGDTYQFHRLGNDVKVLEEMMFGTVGTAYKGSTLKIHHLRSSSQLMVTKVFYPQKPKADSSCVGDVDSDSSGFSSSYAEQLGSGDFPAASQRRTKTNQVTSIPVDVPQVRKTLADSMDEDSALASLTSSGSFQSMFPSPSNSSASSYNSLHRRWMRSQTTSLQSQARRWNSQETLNSPEGSQLPKKKQCKLAVGIVFLMTDEKDEEHRLFQSFFFSHMALIEGHVEQLRSAVERGFFSGRNLVPILFEALDRFKDALHDLYMAPRLQKPVWLSMMSLGSYRYALCDQFVHEFMALATKYDNKSYKFFVSTLISAVLTYHLAWVATVTPGDGAPSKTYLDKHSAKWVDTLAKTHPYNPLWAQLGDLYGAIGQPPKVARTVVVGRKADVVNKFLYVLSYFIRCSDVREVPYSQSLSALLEEQNWEHSTIPSKEDLASTANMLECNQTVSLEAKSHSTQSHSEILDPSSSSINLSSCLCPSCSDLSSENCGSERTSDFVRHDDITENRVNKETLNGCVLASSQDDLACSERMGLSELNPLLVSLENESDKIEKGIFCILSPVQPKEQIKKENVQHVRRSAESERVLVSTGTALPEPESKPDSSTKRPMSLLAQQLQQREKLNQARNQFLAEGSNSMFEEYFEEGIEVKVIDDICERHLLVSHPLVTMAPADTGTAACCTVGDIAAGQQKTLMPSRQNSVKPLVSGPSTFNPGRCRSVMPAELNRRRHLSSTSSLDLETFDPLEHCQEMPMLSVELQGDQSSVEAFDKNFGRSLLAGFSDHYMSDFVLHGTSDTSFRPKLMQDLQASLQHSVLDEPVAESVCIIADTDNWTVEVASSRLLDINPLGVVSWTASQLVTSLNESMLDLNHLKMSSEFCIMHLEDRMQELYFKSLMLAEYIKGMGRYNLHHLNTVLGFDASDIPLLLAIAGTHTPNLALGI